MRFCRPFVAMRVMVAPATVALFSLACAEVAAPMPPEAPPTVRHQAETLPEDGTPPQAYTLRSDLPEARAPRPWVPEIDHGQPTAGEEVTEPASAFIESCLFELDPTLEAALVAEALPAPPPMRLDVPEPCAGDAP